MPQHTEQQILPYSQDQMYRLVSDIEQYPKFLPWCAALRIRDRNVRDNLDVIVADMVVAFQVLREKFRSEVTLDPARYGIEVRYIDGPFKYLTNEWRFTEGDAGGCVVDFHIDFEFRNRTLERLIARVFGRAVEKMVGAFVARAHDVYGEMGAVTADG
jgi:coenzyme Q-binding protein COQ10